ncbi:MAG: DUF6526 family protein [Bryobacteraceae bacterium]
MAKAPLQSYEHHTRFDPLFHFILIPLFLVNLAVRVVYLVRNPALGTGWEVVLAVGLLLLTLKARLYALRVQDRVIRLEERGRIARLVPEPLRSRVDELTLAQLIALRFASDNEVAPLVQRALSDKMSAKDIKKAIQVWRPDYQRV